MRSNFVSWYDTILRKRPSWRQAQVGREREARPPVRLYTPYAEAA